MLNYHYINAEDELFGVIHTNGTTFEDYQKVIEKVQNINYTDLNDRSFLHEAVREKKVDMALDLMKRGIDVDIQDVNGDTAPMFAVSGEQWALLWEIFQYHPNVNLKSWRNGTTLLYDVVCYDNEERNKIALELLRMGANPYAQTHGGNSPINMVKLRENEVLTEAFLQIEKPQQEDPEKFRVPKKRSGIFPVKMRDYRKFYCIENTTPDYLKEKIVDYATICGGEKNTYLFKIIPIDGTPWIMIECPKKMDFCNYHNLMSWIWGLSEDVKPPAQTICVALHKNDERLSYYGIMDKVKFGDNIVGRFQNGESFAVYLPEAYKKDGNAKSYRDVMPIKSIRQYLLSCGFDDTWMDQASHMTYEEIEVEMAI